MSYIPWILAGGATAVIAYNYTKLPGPAGTQNNEVLGQSSITDNRRMPDFDKQSSGVEPTNQPGLGAQLGANPAGAPPQISGFKEPVSATYPSPASTDHFGVINAPDDYAKIVKSSASWLTRHPASVPVPRGKGGDPMSLSKNALSLANLHAVGKGEQYSGAAVPTRLASLPVTAGGHNKAIQHPVKHAADNSRAEKSAWLGSLRAGVYPAVGIHPDSAGNSSSPHTQIKTGRVLRPSH